MILHSADLEQILRRWGRVFGQPPPREWDEDSSHGQGALTSVLLSRLHVGEGATTARARRRPPWIDPATGALVPQHIAGEKHITARGKASRCGSAPWSPGSEVDAVERAALQLYRFNRLRGVVLRVEYCMRGMKQSEKATVVSCTEGIDDRVKLRRYRQELDFARHFMAGQLFGKIFAA